MVDIVIEDEQDIEYVEESPFFKEMKQKEKGRFRRIIGQLRRETGNSFTATEYYFLATIKFYGEEIEKFILRQTPPNVDNALLKEYRRLTETVLNYIQRYREGSDIDKDVISDLRTAIQDGEIDVDSNEKSSSRDEEDGIKLVD